MLKQMSVPGCPSEHLNVAGLLPRCDAVHVIFQRRGGSASRLMSGQAAHFIAGQGLVLSVAQSGQHTFCSDILSFGFNFHRRSKELRGVLPLVVSIAAQ